MVHPYKSQHLGLRHEDHRFKASLGFIMRACLKKEKKKRKIKKEKQWQKRERKKERSITKNF
jgi:hypothetical protein